ncbi:hypothetical protein DPEC_G00151590 [Dallia pectoralis]|uniref:Uncharacterized protein n=1 Tax=Dallia pectoralis TaxID=75939 RepID=A0ACC2GJQ0_DALPE|nr:hypothetical protein DPEC_G00151590 [Dallia pectoralis]
MCYLPALPRKSLALRQSFPSLLNHCGHTVIEVHISLFTLLLNCLALVMATAWLHLCLHKAFCCCENATGWYDTCVPHNCVSQLP